jgi:BirA family biotin operon repressor/biotin-[acetyl-CoA-carboxylase] ligase
MEVIRLAAVASTMDVARALPVGSAVVADHQTAGRGRLGRRFEAPPGTALLASLVVPARPLAPLAAGVAAAHACRGDVRIKWPNDLMVAGRKLAGILVERHGDRCVVGVGINLRWAPPGATMLPVDRDQLLERLGVELERWFGAPDGDILTAWRRRSDTLGQWVRVELSGETFEGLAQDVASDGALVVGGRTVSAGDVIHLRQPGAGSPAAPPPIGPG